VKAKGTGGVHHNAVLVVFWLMLIAWGVLSIGAYFGGVHDGKAAHCPAGVR
jgi:hypothetical protein